MKYQLYTKEHFDKVNGNSYFSARILNCHGEEVTHLPFQYGYGSHSEDMAIQALHKLGRRTNTKRSNEIFSYINKIENCLKRDVKAWGEK